MMRQYTRLRGQLPADVFVFFRLGDFFELFHDDARRGAPLLNVALTARNGIPMCGVPAHALEHYLARLVKAGHRAAVCDQVGEVKPGVLVDRELSRIISAGTVTDCALLESKRHHWLAAVAPGKNGAFGFALLDLSTGLFRVAPLPDAPALLDEIARTAPAEILAPDEPLALATLGSIQGVRGHDPAAFAPDAAEQSLREHFRVQSLDPFGCAGEPACVAAAGAVLHYLRHELRRPLDHITALSTYRTDGFLGLDAATRAHLEIVQPRTPQGTSLLGALDRTVTPMGARQLRQWLLYPLRDLPAIEARQNVIGAWLDDPGRLADFRAVLKDLRDLERAVGRLSQGAGNGRDLAALGRSLTLVPDLRVRLEELPSAPLAARLAGQMHPLPDLVDTLQRAVADEPPAATHDGGIFRDGYDAALDELRSAARDGRDWIAALQEREVARTGIRSLKIRFNSVFGYYFEVTRSNLSLVPADYIRKQTTANAERFYTPELKEVEGRILGADERSQQLEWELFNALREEVVRHAAPLQETAAALAQADALASLAETARMHGHVRPVLRPPGRIVIRDGRHPVLEQSLTETRFVPNDIQLDAEKARLCILTGPNMAGKSTYLRQAALLVLMAQAGAYVPATSAEIGLVDRIFTRIGASDDLARGQSTFLVEMNETANILHHATRESLVILDEIGRGTSTFDGLSIAWSVAEWLHDKVGALTLFATHYHELTELPRTHPAARNLTVAVREWNDEIVFLHRIIEGAADRSYGLQVARLAGLPAPLLARAKELLARLEAGTGPEKPRRKKAAGEPALPPADNALSTQLRLI